MACAKPKGVDDPSRSVGNSAIKQQSNQTMESLQPDEWYEFYGTGGTQIATSCVIENRCGSQMPGWLNGDHPNVEDGVVARQLCFSYNGDCCYHSVDINVRQCFGNYIYKIPKLPERFIGRVCTENEPHGKSVFFNLVPRTFCLHTVLSSGVVWPHDTQSNPSNNVFIYSLCL